MAGPKTDRTLSVAQQYLFLGRNPLCAGEGEIKRDRLRWRFRAQPTALSREYEVEIDYKRDGVPHIRVQQPDLSDLADGRPIPHVYHDPTRLCLYLPRKRQWHAGLRLDQTIVPWTMLWLYYFEEWLATDIWKGEGEHPDPEGRDLENRRARRLMGC